MVPIIISGSRGYLCSDLTNPRRPRPTPNDIAWVDIEIARTLHEFELPGISEVVSGRCPDSPDMAGEAWANMFDVPIKPFPANWREGLGAGSRRNGLMADYGHVALIFWDYRSSGSRDMAAHMQKRGKRYRFVDVLERKW